MSDSNYLSYFITEELYPILGKEPAPTLEPERLAEDQEQKNAISGREIFNTQEEKEQRKSPVPFMVVNNELDDSHVALLRKVLGAIKIELSDEVMASSLDDAQARKVIYFTVNPPPKLSYYQVMRIEEKEILCSRPLSVLQNSVVDKKQLWEALKTWFVV